MKKFFRKLFWSQPVITIEPGGSISINNPIVASGDSPPTEPGSDYAIVASGDSPSQQTAPSLTKAGESYLKQERPPFSEGYLHQFCSECGGCFRSDKLTLVLSGTVILFKDGKAGAPHFEPVFYCDVCAPPAAIRLLLQDTKGELLDEILFRVEGGYFQHVDVPTKEDMQLVTIDEYDHTFCTKCGGLIEETLCQRCRPNLQPKVKGKAKR